MANMKSVNLDPNVEQFSGSSPLIERGWYPAVYASDELKETAKGGMMLVVEIVITAGPSAGADLVDRLNVVNSNDKCQKMAQGKLKLLCEICGVKYPCEDTQPMYGRPVDIFVDLEDATTRDGDRYKRNVIKKYRPPQNITGEAAARQTEPSDPGDW